MSRNQTAGLPWQDQARVTAAEWFAGGSGSLMTRNLRAC